MELLEKIIQKLEFERETLDIKGSGWTLLLLDGLLIRIHKYSPLSGSSFIDLPKCVKNKKAIINVKNSDNMCFKWAILSKYMTGCRREVWNPRYIELDREKNINFSGIDFHTPIFQINKFERNTLHYQLMCLHWTIKTMFTHCESRRNGQT